MDLAVDVGVEPGGGVPAEGQVYPRAREKVTE